MQDQEGQPLSYNRQTGEIPGLFVRDIEMTLATIRQGGRTTEDLSLIHLVVGLARQVDRVMGGTPTRSIGQETPEQIAELYVSRGDMTREEVNHIFQSLGYLGFDRYSEAND